MERSIKRIVCATALVVVTCVIATAPAPCFGQVGRETWQPPEKILDAIGVKPGMRVGEAGAGEGYFTFPLARRVGPRGVVFANDISTSSLEVIRERAGKEGLKNIEIVVGAVEDPLFPEKNLDMVIMVYVLHMLERPIPFLKNLHSYLRPGGLLVVLERNTAVERAHHPSFMTNRQILEAVSETGYELNRTETFLPRDTIYVYAVKKSATRRRPGPTSGRCTAASPAARWRPAPAVLELAQVVVVDHEQVAARVEGPAQARVRCRRLVSSVSYCTKLSSCRSGERFSRTFVPTTVRSKSPSVQVADVRARRSTTKVTSGEGVQRASSSIWSSVPSRSRRTTTPPPPTACAWPRCLRLDPVAQPVVRAGRDDDAVRDLERLHQLLAHRARALSSKRSPLSSRQLTGADSTR